MALSQFPHDSPGDEYAELIKYGAAIVDSAAAARAESVELCENGRRRRAARNHVTEDVGEPTTENIGDDPPLS